MATKKKKKRTTKKRKKTGQLSLNIFGLIFFVCGLMALFQLGFVGTAFTNIFRFFVGNTYPIAAILYRLYGLFLLIFGQDPSFKNKRVIGLLLLYSMIILFAHALLFAAKEPIEHIMGQTWEWLLADLRINGVRENLGGGMLGALLYSASHFLFAQWGTYIVSVILMIVALLFIFDVPFTAVSQFIKKQAQLIGHVIMAIFTKYKTSRKTKQIDKEKLASNDSEKVKPNKNKVKPLTPGQKLAQEHKEITENAEPEQLSLQIESYQKNLEKTQQSKSKPQNESVAVQEDEINLAGTEEVENRDYQLPSSNLLTAIPVVDQGDEYQLIEQNVQKLEQTFKSFGVDAKVIRASLGPSVTKYEVQPAVGVKVSKIVSLSDDLALALAAKDIRIEAPIPGKSFIGIEVPNNHVSTVSFRDIIESQPSHPDHLLEVPLGRNISGEIVTCDLAKMPHLLIAGSTGSGKSVCVNGIITSILMNAKPHEVKLMLIDPKKVELNVYNGIPHLLTPVVTNPRKAAQALQKVVAKMEERYEKFAATGTRNINGYNKLMMERNLEKGENHPVLPYIVVVVDELADLMMVASNEVEDAIIRLAQMARAAGIHMILATQRPSVDVITGLIKANVPSRIAFAVSSGVDSRTIIDSNGAEKLLGRGDMLYLPMGENKPMRVQGAFISDEDVEKIVTFVSKQQEAEYQEDMMPEEIEISETDQAVDELYEDAMAFVVMKQSASVSMLQRRFRIGYNRAGRLIDEMEMRGVIGPSEGSKARKVLIPESMLEDLHE